MNCIVLRSGKGGHLQQPAKKFLPVEDRWKHLFREELAVWPELSGQPRGRSSKLWGSGQGSARHHRPDKLGFSLAACIGSHWGVFWKCTGLKDDAVCSVKNKLWVGKSGNKDLLEIIATAQGKTVMHRQK